MWENKILYLAAFAIAATIAVSAPASNNESAVSENNQENYKIDANIPVVVILKEQPLHKVSSNVKKEHRKRFKEITKSAKEIYGRIKPLTGSEEELRAKNISELVAVEQSLLTEKEKVLLVEVEKNLESNITEMRREIFAQTAPLIDKVQEPIIDKIRAKGGSVKYSSKVFNAIAADIPVSYIEELSKEPRVYKIYHDHVLNEDIDVSTGAMVANSWWNGGYTGTNRDVAVVDSGIDGSHPALVQSVHYAGVFHDTAKTNSSYADNSSSTDDLRGHGTHVAGIVASTDSGYKGVAYGSKLINAKAGWLGKNGTAEMYESDAMKAIDWALFGNPDDADVISFSFGNGSTNGDSSFEHFMDAVAYELDTPVAKSAGNGGSGGGTITDPGGAFNIIIVGNVDDKNTVSRSDDLLRSSSSRGPTPDGRIKPDISAPGTNIMSANSNWESEAYFVSKTGASMAAPHIAGSIILLLNYKYYPSEAIKALLLNTAEDMGTAGPDNDYGFGYADLSHAYIHRDDVFTGSVADLPQGSVEKFFKGNASIGDKATLVWNRHVDYINSIYPTTYYNITNLDLYMYDEASGGLVSSSTSDVNNVEQVKSNANYTSVVLKIEPGIFPDGISLEDYALATEEGFTEVSQPRFNLNINSPGSAASGTNFNIDATVTNTGGVAAHNVDVAITLPSGFTIVSGANPQPSGTINAGSSKTATWVVQAPGIASSTSYTLDASASSYSYGDSYSGSGISTITVTATATPAYSVSGYVSDNYGAGLGDVVVQNGSRQNITSASGYYLITGLQKGAYNFSYSKSGFDTGYLEVMISDADNTSADMKIYDNAPPDVVTGLKNDTAGQTAVNLSWNPVADANYYQVFRNSASTGYSRNAYWNDTGLAPDNLYEYMVKANDSYNNWGQNSSILTVMTAPAVDTTLPPEVATFDINSDGIIQRAEAASVVVRFFQGEVPKSTAVAVLVTYFSTPTTGASSNIVTRTFSASTVPPGGTLTVTITPDTNVAGGLGYQVTETLPAGVAFVSSTADHAASAGQVIKFTMMGAAPFTYTVAAPNPAGIITFSGTFKDSFNSLGTVTGASIVTVVTSPLPPEVQPFDTSGNGTIERSEAVSAVVQFFNGVPAPIPRTTAVAVVLAFFNQSV